MNIYWGKWIVEMLPFALRRQRIKAFCAAMTRPIVTLWTDTNTWKKQIQIKLGTIPQAIMLQKIIKDSLGINVTITEGDGKPIDFIVNAPITDPDKKKLLLELLDRYKQAGKSYNYENTATSFEYLWTRYIGELQGVVFSWDKHACEIKINQQLPLNNVYVRCEGPYIYVRTDYPPASNLAINYNLTYKIANDSIIHPSSGVITYIAGSTTETKTVSTAHEFPQILTADIALRIDRDNTYFYFIVKTII